jgi:hypothetical protein
MSAGYLTERQIEILKSLRHETNEATKQLLDRAISGTLPRGEIEIVCQTINDEFLMNADEPVILVGNEQVLGFMVK